MQTAPTSFAPSRSQEVAATTLDYDKAAFDYGKLPTEIASEVRSAADRIRSRIRASILETGRDLIAIKGRLRHGQFKKWLEAELSINMRSAENYMNAARFVEGKPETLSHLPATTLYALAAPTTPTKVVEEVIAAAEKGKLPSPRQIRNWVSIAPAVKQSKARKPRKSAERAAQEEKARAKREAREAAKCRAEQRKRDQEEQERVARLRPLADRVSRAVSPPDLAELIRLLSDNRELQTMNCLLAAARPVGAAMETA